MSIPCPYFKDTPLYGDLRLEKTIVDYDYPLLMVLQDNSGGRFLCMCYDITGSQQWLVSPITNEDLAALLQNKIALAEALKDRNSKKVLASMDYKTRVDSFQLLDSEEVPEWIYPNPDDYLDPDPGEFDDYLMIMKSN